MDEMLHDGCTNEQHWLQRDEARTSHSLGTWQQSSSDSAVIQKRKLFLKKNYAGKRTLLSSIKEKGIYWLERAVRPLYPKATEKRTSGDLEDYWKHLAPETGYGSIFAEHRDDGKTEVLPMKEHGTGQHCSKLATAIGEGHSRAAYF
eukprot:1145956-Pelagomonas_calceolata.AAC.7